MSEKGLGHLFAGPVQRTPHKPAVIQGPEAVTYAQLDRRANRVAHAIAGLAPAGRRRVALLLGNDHRFVEIYFGVLRAGGVVIPINHRLGARVIGHVVEHADAEVLISTREHLARLDGLPGSLAVVVLDDERSGGGRRIDYAEWVAPAAEEPLELEIAGDQIALQLYTSGSTGVPKGCLLDHQGQLWNVRASARARRVHEDDIALTAAPLCHKNAMASAVKLMLAVGGSMVIEPRFDPASYLDAIERERVTITTGVPTMYRRLFDHPRDGYDTTSVRLCFVGSSEVPARLVRDMRSTFRGARVCEGYGSTEGGPVGLVQDADGGPGLLPLDGCEVELVDERGRPCPMGVSGELRLRNPGVLRGYYKDPAATRSRLRDGWYSTGDLARTDDGRAYVMVGRRDDMIVTSGENVYPHEVEATLLAHPGVAQVCVVSAPDEVKGEIPVAFVVRTGEPPPTAEELKAFARERGSSFAYPRIVVFVETLPQGSSGKVDRRRLREEARRPVTVGGG